MILFYRAGFIFMNIYPDVNPMTSPYVSSENLGRNLGL
jgi:hypothetical protein